MDQDGLERGVVMKGLLSRTVGLVFLMGVSFIACFAQTDPMKNILGQSPPKELKKFEPYLGRYEATVMSRDQKTGELKPFWTGTWEWKMALENWYVEWNLIRQSAGPHRHFRVMMTWDNQMKKYRFWRFETLNPNLTNDGVIRFEGDEMIMEWKAPKRDGGDSFFRNHVRVVSGDLYLSTEERLPDGKIVPGGAVTGKRKC
jgi:hypothetical protein